MAGFTYKNLMIVHVAGAAPAPAPSDCLCSCSGPFTSCDAGSFDTTLLGDLVATDAPASVANELKALHGALVALQGKKQNDPVKPAPAKAVETKPTSSK